MNTDLILRSLREAVATLLAALATMACAWAIDPEPGPAILSVVLCVALSRSQLDRDLRGRIEAAVTLPVVSIAAIGVAALLRHAPWSGAIVFTAGIALSIWLRRFGAAARRAGSLIALPFVVILATPYVPVTRVGHALALLLPIIVALLALFWVSAFHALARRVGWLPPARGNGQHATSATAGTGSLRPVASTRMAIQMAVALGAAFAVGYLAFGERWSWVVLTAYIVGSGSQGRLDVVYKSVLRVIGAAAGTLFAVVFTVHLGSHGLATPGLMLAAVFFGVWLRPLGYAWWALFVTIALALLQGFEGVTTSAILWPRVEEIIVGALIGIGAAWFVLPIRSTDVLRRRIADALAALAEAVDPETAVRSPDRWNRALDDMEKVAPAFRALRFATRRLQAQQPADWIDAMAVCRAPADALIGRGDSPPGVRHAIGAARKSMREPATIPAALAGLRASLG